MLIQTGENINHSNENNDCPLSIAIKQSNIEIAKALIERKVDLRWKNTNFLDFLEVEFQNLFCKAYYYN